MWKALQSSFKLKLYHASTTQVSRHLRTCPWLRVSVLLWLQPFSEVG